MNEMAEGRWHAVTPLRDPGDSRDAEGGDRDSGGSAERFPVVRRFRALVGKDHAWLDARPEWRLRAALGDLLHVCGRLGLSDTGLGTVLEAFARARDLRSDPAQHRTGTEVESRTLDALDRLGEIVGDRATWPADSLTAVDRDEMEEAFRVVPAESLLEYVVPGEWPFALICWGAATTLLEGVDMPFVTAHRIVRASDADPPDPDGLVAPMRRLRDLWWSADGEQPAIAEEIRGVLVEYVARAPYPR